MGPTTFFATTALSVWMSERLLRDDLFQAMVLVFDLLQPLHLTELHAACTLPFHRSSSERRASFYGLADYGGQVS